jgi:SNF2 family DNA or RNA helicase
VLAEGVSLHYAKHLVHFDSRWNPSKTIQREGRINRICMDGNEHDICIYKFIVPPFINAQIELTEKVVRKESESEIILNNLNNDFENYLIDLDKIDNTIEVETTVPIFYNDKTRLAHFVNDTQFYLLESDGKLIKNNSKLTLKPFRRYALSEDRELSDVAVFNTFSEYVETAKRFNRDARFMGNYNITTNGNLDRFYSSNNKTTRSNAHKTEFSNFMRSKQFREAIDKAVSVPALDLMEYSFISYPMGFVWRSVKGKSLEDYIEAAKFMCELLNKIENDVKNLIVRI